MNALSIGLVNMLPTSVSGSDIYGYGVLILQEIEHGFVSNFLDTRITPTAAQAATQYSWQTQSQTDLLLH